MPRTFAQGIGLLLGLAFALWLSPLVARGETPSATEALEAELHERVQAVRAERRLVALARRPELDRIAREHSLDMARRGYLAHDTPEGRSPLDRLQGRAALGFTLAAENIGQSTERAPMASIVEGWLGSPPHRRNLFTPPFNHTGIGVVRAPDGSFIATQVYLSYPR